MDIQVVKHELSVPKETKEAIDLLAAIAAKIKAGGKITDYADLFDEAIVAFKGADMIDDEFKAGKKGDIAAYLLATVGGVFV